MNLEKFNNLQLKSITDEMYMERLNDSNYLINKVADNEKEFEMLLHLKQVIKNEMIQELNKHIDSFKFFAGVR